MEDIQDNLKEEEDDGLEEGTEKESKMSKEEIIELVKIYGIEVLKYSWLMIIAGVLLGWQLRQRKLKSPTTFTAQASFKMDENSSVAQQNIASLFGAAVGGGGESSKMTLKSLKEIIKTRLIIHKTMFRKATLKYNGEHKEDFLINHYLRKFFYKEEKPDNYYFKDSHIDPFDRKANRYIKSVHSAIANDYIRVDITPTGTIHLKSFSQNEDFSYELTMALYHQLDSFYRENKIKKKQAFYEMTVLRTSDLRDNLQRAEESYISHMNKNSAEAHGVYNTTIRTQYLSTDLRSATETYFGALRSQEAAWMAYQKQKQSAMLQMIDQPLYPLDADKPNPFVHMVLGFILGFGSVFALVLGVKYIRLYLAKQKEEKEGEEETEEQEDNLIIEEEEPPFLD